jgi:hypothetical protein
MLSLRQLKALKLPKSNIRNKIKNLEEPELHDFPSSACPPHAGAKTRTAVATRQRTLHIGLIDFR